MPNIAITTNCNLSCKYCFANEFVGSSKSNEMSFANYLLVKKFILKSGCREFGLIGGEPSIHSEFKKILQDCINDYYVQKVRIYTNGIKLKEYLGEYTCSKFRFLINCNSPEVIGEKNYATLCNNLVLFAKAYNAKNRITLGINLYHPHQEFQYIIDLCKKLELHELRVSITTPLQDIDMHEYFAEMKPLLMSFYRELIKYHIQPKYDCNVMPSCVYTEKELFEMATLLSNSGPERSRLIGEKSICRPVIDILPDLTAIRCFGMSDVCKVKITEFKSVTDLANFFLKEIDFRIANTLKHNDCDSCYKYKTLQCAGGCLCFRKKYLKGVN